MSDETEKNHVHRIYSALMGRPVLLPIEKGEKGPFYDGWERITYENTQDPAFVVRFSRAKKGSDGEPQTDAGGNPVREVYRTENYQEYLARGNVGVLLGGASSYQDPTGKYHLCSIDIDEDSELEPFLEANPKLRGSLRTVGSRGGNIWLWVRAGEYPPMAKLKFADGRLGDDNKPKGWGEWRSETFEAKGIKARRFQTVIWGTHPKGMQYRRVGEAVHPLRVDFTEINWPPSVEIPWRKSAWDELVERCGMPWQKSKNGAITVNPPFFVVKYSQEHRVLHEPDEGRFYDYCAERGLWVEDSEDKIRWKFSDDFKRVADDADEPGIELKRTNAFLQGLVQQLKGCVEKRQAFLREAGIVHLLNGMLDVRKSPPTLSSFAPEYYSRNQLAVEYRETKEMPLFMGMMTAAYDTEDIDLLQRWGGQVLLGVNLTQKIMLMTGNAGTGKSTFINVLRRLVGEENYAGLRTEQLHQRFELFNYVGKTFLIGSDVPGNFLMTEGAHWLKALVGRDVVPAEKKNGDTVNIIGDFNIGMTSNSRLKVRMDGDTDAWRRRLMIVHSGRPPPTTPNPHLAEDIFASEASAVLNWLIAGAMKLLADIANKRGMVMTGKQVDRVDSLLAESDSVKQFVRKGVMTADVSSSLTKHELCEAYVHYCEARGWSPLTTRKVEQQLPDAILEIHRLAQRNDIVREGKNQRGYKGLRMLVDSDRQDAPEDANA